MQALDLLVGNPLVCWICMGLLVFVIWLNRGYILYASSSELVEGDKSYGGTGYLTLWIVFTLYSILFCPQNGDNLSSLMIYYEYLAGASKETLHFEPLHFWIMDIVPYGYVAWRFFTWGILGATAFVMLCKKLVLNQHLATLSCLTFALPVLLYYQRAAAGYSLLFLAFIYLMNEASYLKRGTCFLILTLLALPFHNAIGFYLIVLLIAYIFPLNTKSVWVLLALCVITYFSIIDYATTFLENATEAIHDTGIRYIENTEEATGRNLFGWLDMLIFKAPFYCMLIYCVTENIIYKEESCLEEEFFLKCTLLLILLSILFSSTSNAIFVKFYNFAMLPWTLFLALYFERNVESRICKYFTYSIFISYCIHYGFAIIKGTLI